MYAVIRTGGKQYRVQEGDRVKVEKLPVPEGSKIELLDVLLVGEGYKVKLGKPVVQGAKVEAEVVRQGKHKKIDVFKFKRRKAYRRRRGHRQEFTELKITGITAP